jgi:hypothetical protein
VQNDIDKASQGELKVGRELLCTFALFLFSAPQEMDPQTVADGRPLLMGQVAGAIDDIKPAKQIVEEMVKQAVETLRENYAMISPPPSKL